MKNVIASAKKHSPVALITGGGRERIGNVIARGLAQDGYRIALHYNTSKATAIQTRDSLRKHHVQCDAFQADVTNESEVDNMIAQIVETFGRIDVVVTTAANWLSATLEDTTAEAVLKSFEVNALGTFLVARAAGLVMVNQENGGNIVTIGDGKIDRPYLNHAAYLISKGCIPAMTKVLALELGERNPNVRVNCIHPGPVMFPPQTTEAEEESLINSTLVKKANLPDAMTLGVRFLLQNPMVTGTCLPIDGGQHFYHPGTSVRQRQGPNGEN